jgi:histidine ammonia-lyase
MSILLDGKGLNLEEVREFLEESTDVNVSAGVVKKLTRVRKFVEKKLESHKPYYGINTGFGILANVRIDDKDLGSLQENLILSHAVGVGDPFDETTARLIMLLRASVLSQGYSGVRPEVLDLLVTLINRRITPVIPIQGSVSASGDLAPLAHIALVLTGKGEVMYRGQLMPSMKAFKKEGLKPIELLAKEGIALINGTQATAAMAAQAVLRSEMLIKVADIAGAMSVEGDRASRRPFDPRIHHIRPHPGQIATARNVCKMIAGSRIIADHAKCTRVQDPYSFRCIPQVHGAVKDMYHAAKKTVEIELKSCTDNPLLFDQDDEIISGGNFHAEPVAIMMDALGLAIAELGSISERRVAILNSPLQDELPNKGLVPNPGLNSGMLTAHVTMASLASENKTMAHPASVDTIPTFGGQEDHVSMGLIAARKTMRIVQNVEKILAIELIAACQAIDLASRGKKPGRGSEAIFKLIRKGIPYMEKDRELRLDIEKSIDLVASGTVITTAESTIGNLSVG